jgi:hypothetical protein
MWVYQGNGDVHMRGDGLPGVNPQLNTGDTIHCVLDLNPGAGSLSCTAGGMEYLVRDLY